MISTLPVIGGSFLRAYFLSLKKFQSFAEICRELKQISQRTHYDFGKL